MIIYCPTATIKQSCSDSKLRSLTQSEILGDGILHIVWSVLLTYQRTVETKELETKTQWCREVKLVQEK